MQVQRVKQCRKLSTLEVNSIVIGGLDRVQMSAITKDRLTHGILSPLYGPQRTDRRLTSDLRGGIRVRRTLGKLG